MSLMQTLKRPAVLGTLLAVSAAGNLFLGGVLAGRIGGHAMHPPRFERDFESRLRAVPEERRREIHDMLRQGKAAVGAQHEAMRELHESLVTELTRDHPDRALLERQMTDMRTRKLAMQEALQKSFLDTALALAPEERREMLDAMQEQRKRGGWHRRSGGPGGPRAPRPDGPAPGSGMPPPPEPPAPGTP